jgi:hypothetical protein
VTRAGAATPVDAGRAAAPTTVRLPAALRWSGLAAAAGVGVALGAGIGLVALVRRDRPMHAVGRTYHAGLTPLTPAEQSGVLWLDTLSPRDGLVRFSRGAGLPPWAPDVQGVAVRLPERRGHTDLLFSSTGRRGIARFVLVPRRSPLGGPSGTLMPFRGPRGPLVLAVEPVPADRTTEPPAADGVAPSAGARPGTASLTGTRWRLLWSGVTGPWHPFAELVVGADAGPVVDSGTRFDPLGATPPDLPSYRWAAALRSPAYRLAQLLGRGRSHGA